MPWSGRAALAKSPIFQSSSSDRALLSTDAMALDLPCRHAPDRRMQSGAIEVARAHAVESGRPARGDLAQGDGRTPAARLAAERHRRGWQVGGDDFPLRRGGWSDVGGLYAAAPEERLFGRTRPATDG